MRRRWWEKKDVYVFGDASRRTASTLAASTRSPAEIQWRTFSGDGRHQSLELNQWSYDLLPPLPQQPPCSHRTILQNQCIDSRMALSSQPLHSLQKRLTENLPRNCITVCGNMVDREIQELCRKDMLDVAFVRLDALSVLPCHETLVFLLKACTRLGSPSHAKNIHAFLLRHQVPLQGSLGEHLISALAKCGRLHDACTLLDSLPCRTSLSWSSVIFSLVQQGYPQEALSMYARMLKDGVRATSHTFVSLFKACGNIPNLEQGRELHAIARLRGITSEIFVGNILISMYRKFGSILEGEEVFSEMPQHDHVSWNSMLSAYLSHEAGEKALMLYRQMRMENWYPNPQTCVLILQACALLIEQEETNPFRGSDEKIKYLSIVHSLHAEARRFGFDVHPFVGTTLVTLYGKCGTIREAEQISSSILDQDVVSWTALFSAYSHQGQGVKALQVYKKMLEEGMDPDPRSFAIALQACEALTQEDTSNKGVALEIVKALHNDAWSKGFASDAILGSLLVILYNKCGTIKDAEDMFCELPHRDFTVWTAMVSAYVDDCQGQKAIWLYRQMLAEGIRPDNQSFATALQACGTLAQEDDTSQLGTRLIKERSFDISRGLHADARRRDSASDSFVCNMLISAYGKCGAISEAENVFATVPQPDKMSWLKILTAYLEQGQGESTLLLFRLMQERGTHPNPQILLVAVLACGLLAVDEETIVVQGRFIKMRSLEFGQALLADARKEGYNSDIFVATALVNLLGKCGSIEDAEHVCGAMFKPDVVLWTAMLSAYLEQGQGEKALDLYGQMHRDCLVALDDVIIVCVLQACGKTGNLETARDIHSAICFSELRVGGFLASILTYVYGSCASIEDLQAVYDVLVEPDLVTVNACIAGHAGEGNLLACEQMAQEMQLVGCKPDEVTFVSLLSACSHVGLVYRGLEFVESFSRDHKLTFDLKHFSTLLDLLGRAGDFGKIENLLQALRFRVDAASWLCLLGACRIHGNVTLARHAFDVAVSMQPNEAALYILMSRMYVEAGMQHLAEEVDKLRPQVFKDGMAWELD